jgi:Hint domain
VVLITICGCSATAPSQAPSGSPTSSASPTLGGSLGPTGGPGPSAIPTDVPSGSVPTASPMPVADLAYVLLDQFGAPDWCDPDFYPLAREDEETLAQEHLADMRADGATFAAIEQHLGIDAAAALTTDQVVAIYRDWKVITKALHLEPAGDAWSFDYVAQTGTPQEPADTHVAGSISGAGAVDVTTSEPAYRPSCPICLVRGTLIATPAGPLAVDTLHVGMPVWTLDASGARVAATIIQVGSTPVPATHQVVQLVLADGRAVEASPGHPLADGRLIGSLRAGDAVDGSEVVGAVLIPYGGGATFDLLPSGPSGTYWAGGIPLRSTLSPQAP